MARAGIFGIGLDTYWDQFDGLRDHLVKYQDQIAERIQGSGIPVTDAGLVDSIGKARAAAKLFEETRVDVLFLYVSTYALSSTVLPVIKAAGAPVVILNLQPVAALDYKAFNLLNDRGKMTGVWLEHCQACAVPEIASVLNRSGLDFNIVTGYLEEEAAWREIREWIGAVKVKAALKDHNMGVLGHYYGGMLDVYTDLTKMSACFGTHFEILEMCELRKYRDAVTDAEVQGKISEFATFFNISKECGKDELARAALTSVALEKLVQVHELGSMAYYYEGEAGNAYEEIVTSVIAGNTLLTGKGIPVAGECEVKNAHAMKIMSELGAGGSFSEFYLMDFNDDVVMLGHDGPAHPAIASEKVRLVPLPVYHGKPGKGLSIQMTIAHGPVTLLSVVEGKDDIFLLTAEGESVKGPVLEIGNTNSRYRFPISARTFINQWSAQGPAHHCAIGTGNHAGEIEKLGRMLGIKTVRVC